ncbi:MAG TPA: hypothetical protein VJ836_06045 [Candidatus Saccharimonadales bacterium]|nr:hypothetical protein [Candidatus Saccharimonadales bacterium]
MAETTSNRDIAAFISRIMNINATLPGMGGASAGITGTTSPAAPTVDRLKKVVIEFATECRKNPQSNTAGRLAEEAEGLLSVLQSMSVISGSDCDNLVLILHGLRHTDS